MQLLCQFFPIRAVLFHHGKPDGGADAAFAQKIEQVREKHRVAPITNFIALITVGQHVFNITDGKRMPLLHGRFEQ